jgi:hypothetical protein
MRNSMCFGVLGLDKLPATLGVAAALWFIAGIANCQVLTYELLDGNISSSAGGSGQITGSFQLVPSGSSGGYDIFDMTAFSFTSNSLAVSLDPSELLTVQAATGGELAIFSGAVDLKGFGDSQGTIIPSAGTQPANALFTGPGTLPTTFHAGSLMIDSSSTGLRLGELLIDAELVPEPSTLLLLVAGAIGLLFAKRRLQLTRFFSEFRPSCPTAACCRSRR